MERYRPLLEPLVYDETEYSSYLEQLGVSYPVLTKPSGTDPEK
jgi:aminobenzoyl-glutamate utilization protein B